MNGDGGNIQNMSLGISANGFVGLGYSSLAILLSVLTFIIMVVTPWLLGRRIIPSSRDSTLVGTNSRAISAACHPSSLTKAGLGFEYDDGRLHLRAQNNLPVASKGVPLSDAIPQGAGDQTPCVDETGQLISGKGDDSPVIQVREQSASDTWNPVLSEENLLEKRQKGDYLAESEIRFGAVEMPAAFYEGAPQRRVNPGEIEEVETGNEIIVGHLSFGVKEDNVEYPKKGQWYI
jgi:hypothetical protein